MNSNLQSRKNNCISEKVEKMSEREGEGLAVGALDIILLVVAAVVIVLLIMRWRKRGKKELVRKVSVPGLL